MSRGDHWLFRFDATVVVGFFPTHSDSSRTAIFFSEPADDFPGYSPHMGKSNPRSAFHRLRRLSVPFRVFIRLRDHSSRQSVRLIQAGAGALSLPLRPPSLHARRVNHSSPTTPILRHLTSATFSLLLKVQHLVIKGVFAFLHNFHCLFCVACHKSLMVHSERPW